ncbi:MAG TPA: asparagine synthase C-terminal domain-containing protein [Thermoplasmata archaeon]|nr:asparagine synthase C-terminal domain-containing protein [Thermoplasmata archaeon]
MRRSLVDQWTSAVDRAVGGDARVSILYSGGLDSSVIAHTLRPKRPTLVTVGIMGAADIAAATEGAQLLELPLVVRTLTEGDVEEGLRTWGRQLDGMSETTRSVALGIALASEAAPDHRVLCGQGADELFLGYAHFAGLPSADLEQRANDDWQRLLDRDWPLAQVMVSTVEKRLGSPYLDPAFANEIRSIPIGERMVGGSRKPVLRQLARDLGVPSVLADRPKKALQFGSGLARLLRTMKGGRAPFESTGPTRE